MRIKMERRLKMGRKQITVIEAAEKKKKKDYMNKKLKKKYLKKELIIYIH